MYYNMWDLVSSVYVIFTSYFILSFLDDFAKLRKAAISFVMFSCPSVYLYVSLYVLVEQLGFHWADFHEILCLRIAEKYLVKITCVRRDKVSLN
jgi:hypothetical protein